MKWARRWTQVAVLVSSAAITIPVLLVLRDMLWDLITAPRKALLLEWWVALGMETFFACLLWLLMFGVLTLVRADSVTIWAMTGAKEKL